MKTTPHELEAALRHDAAAQRGEPSPGFAARLQRAVHTAAAQPAPAAPAPRFRFFLVGGSLATALLLAAVVLTRLPSRSDLGISDSDTAALVAGARALPGQVWSTIEPETSAVLGPQPLQTEANAIAADARSAVSFLALNFLPNPPPARDSRNG